MVDFSYNGKKEYAAVLASAKQKMEKRIMNLTKVYVTKFISSKNVRDAIRSADELANTLKENMKDAIAFNAGTEITIQIAPKKGILVV